MVAAVACISPPTLQAAPQQLGDTYPRVRAASPPPAATVHLVPGHVPPAPQAPQLQRPPKPPPSSPAATPQPVQAVAAPPALQAPQRTGVASIA